MKVLRKILIYLIAIVLNAAVYVVIFSMAAGMNMTQGGNYIKTKVSGISKVIEGTAKKEEKVSTEGQDIQKEKLLVEAQKQELKQQMQQITKEKSELESVKKQIQDLLGAKSKAQEDKMYGLAKIFDGMDKQKVAQVFAAMNDTLIVSILPKMKAANASLVLQNMETSRSAQISRMILGGS